MKQSGLGVASLVLGIMGMLLSIVVIGILPCLIGLVFAIIALTKKDKAHGTAIGGLVCSTIGITIFVLLFMMSSGDAEEPRKASEQIEVTTMSVETEQKNYEGEETKAKDDIVDDNIIDVVLESCSVVYDGYEIASDYDGNDCVVIYYLFTNHDEETRDAALAVYMQVFQDGVECENAFFSSKNEYMENWSKQVTNGTTIRVGEAFKISSMSDLEIQVKEALSFSDKKDKMTLGIE